MSDVSYESTNGIDNFDMKLPPTKIKRREVSCSAAASDNVVVAVDGDSSLTGAAQYSSTPTIYSENKQSKKDADKNRLTNGTTAVMNDKEKLLSEARKEFHGKRYLILKNVPVNATDEDIRNGFDERFEIKEVSYNRSLQTAKVTLVNPELLDAWPPGDVEIEISDQLVVVKPSDTDGMLCVAHLPFIYTEDDFRNLVQMYGPVASCFLCRSEKTGEQKGYGFVEYSSRDVAYKAKPLLEQKTLGDCQIKCCWLEPSHVTYNSLHSKCLFVDHLPNGYRDMVEFRRIFSVISSPSYCQIGIRNGQPLGFGLVEFDTADDAEETQKLLNHSKVDEHQIRVTYCSPGYRAMVIYNKLTSGLASNVKQPLLPDPPRNSDMARMISMSNPSLYQSQSNNVGNRSWENGHRATNGNFAESQPFSFSSASSNSSLQEAVILLLATQLQSQLGMQQSSIFNNPQSLTMMLQAAIGQQNNETQELTETLRNLLLLFQQVNGQSRCQTSQTNAAPNGNSCPQWQPPKTMDGKTYNKVPLLPDPPCVKQMDSCGLLPTPPLSKLHLNAFCNGGQGNFMNSALHNGNQQQPLFVKTQTEMKTPYENQGRQQKVPLLGDKPANVSLSGPNVIPQNGFSILSPSNSNNNDPNNVAQILTSLLLKQTQMQQQNSKLSKVSENLVFQPSKNGSQAAPPPALVGLLLQSIQRLQQQQQQQGELNKNGNIPNQNGFQFPLNLPCPFPNLFLGASAMAAQKQALFGSAPFVSPPAQPTAAGPRHVLTMTPPVATKQPPPMFTTQQQPFLFQSQNGHQVRPLAAAQLMAEIQQRGSLLGDFWQASQALGGAHLTNPLIANLGYQGLTKRKLFDMGDVGELNAEQLKKRRI